MKAVVLGKNFRMPFDMIPVQIQFGKRFFYDKTGWDDYRDGRITKTQLDDYTNGRLFVDC